MKKKTIKKALLGIMEVVDGMRRYIHNMEEDLNDRIEDRIPQQAICQYKLTSEAAVCPHKAHQDDAGLDLYIQDDVYAKDADFTHMTLTVDTGVCVKIPEGYCGLVCPRSGLAMQGIAPILGVVDAGYTGTIKITIPVGGQLLNNPVDPLHVLFSRGDRVAQLVVVPIAQTVCIPVTEFDETERGENGFGSTGV